MSIEVPDLFKANMYTWQGEAQSKQMGVTCQFVIILTDNEITNDRLFVLTGYYRQVSAVRQLLTLRHSVVPRIRINSDVAACRDVRAA